MAIVCSEAEGKKAGEAVRPPGVRFTYPGTTIECSRALKARGVEEMGTGVGCGGRMGAGEGRVEERRQIYLCRRQWNAEHQGVGFSEAGTTIRCLRYRQHQHQPQPQRKQNGFTLTFAYSSSTSSDSLKKKGGFDH